MQPTLVVATRNPHKLAELQSLLASVSSKIVSVSDFADIPEIAEDCDTLEGNALKKAKETAQHLRACGAKEPFIALADDSGLEVDALGGAPGVFSARFAEFDGAFPDKNVSSARSTRKVTYHDNNVKLLRLLEKILAEKLTARFRCVIALVSSEGQQHLVQGVCEGKIIREARGTHGFGYDPLFIPDGYEQSFAELSDDIKNRISHRGRAIEKAKEILQMM